MEQTYDVLVVGGGIAGVAAARALSRQPSLTWCLLEATQRLGGRIESVLMDGKRVDTGAYELASFLQARKQENSLYELIKKGECELDFRKGLSRVLYYEDKGHEYSEEQVKQVYQTLQSLAACVAKWVAMDPGLSVEECCRMFEKQGGLAHLDASQRKLFDLLILMEEQEQAADGHDLAADSFFADGDMEEDCLDTYPLPAITYDGLLQQLTRDLPRECLRFNTSAEHIELKGEGCAVTVQEKGSAKRVIKSKYVVCGVPLPVIKSKALSFTPELPAPHSFIFDNLGFGFMEKIILAFEEPFWPPDVQRIKIACQKKGEFPHFCNLSGQREQGTGQAHILCCYITAEYAVKELAGHSDQQIIEEAVEQLQRAFPSKQIRLKQGHVTRWMDREHVHGSFSYMRPKLRFEKAKEIRLPVGGRLWFVGEYCYPENIGCAHGAFETGHRAALAIIAKQAG